MPQRRYAGQEAWVWDVGALPRTGLVVDGACSGMSLKSVFFPRREFCFLCSVERFLCELDTHSRYTETLSSACDPFCSAVHVTPPNFPSFLASVFLFLQ